MKRTLSMVVWLYCLCASLVNCMVPLLYILTYSSSYLWSEVKMLSCFRLFVTPWMVAYQAPRSMGFSKQEHWSGLPFPSPWDLPNSGIKPGSPALQTDALLSEPLEKPILMKYYSYLFNSIFIILLKFSNAVGDRKNKRKAGPGKGHKRNLWLLINWML